MQSYSKEVYRPQEEPRRQKSNSVGVTQEKHRGSIGEVLQGKKQ